MSLNKKSIIAILICNAILAAIYTLIVFWLFAENVHANPLQTSLSYVLGLVSLIISTLAELCLTRKDQDSVILSLPNIIISNAYVIFEVVFTLSIIALRIDNNLVVFLPQIILLAICVILLTLSTLGILFITHDRDEVKKKRDNIASLIVELKSDDLSLKNESNKENMKKLIEVIQFSDPMSAKNLEKDEELIACKVHDLKEIILSNDENKINESLIEIMQLMEIRNLKVKSLK